MGSTVTDRTLIGMPWGELGDRFLTALVLWWVLSEGESEALAAGALVSALVAVISVRVFPRGRHRLRWRAAPAFVLFFTTRSIVAGLDVARRLLTPSLPISPGMLVFDLQVPDGAPRWLLANTLSLLPGTLSVELRGDRLDLHCLDTETDIAGAVHDTERRVAALFSVPPALSR